jgi:hypothetical protein
MSEVHLVERRPETSRHSHSVPVPPKVHEEQAWLLPRQVIMKRGDVYAVFPKLGQNRRDF